MPVFKTTSFVSLSCEAVLHRSEGRELLEALFVETLHSRCFFFWLLFCSLLLYKLSKSLFWKVEKEIISNFHDFSVWDLNRGEQVLRG